MRIVSLRYTIAQLTKPRSNEKFYADLKVLDGMRVVCCLWVMMLGTCSFTMSSAKNPWTLQKYFQTWGYTAVYSANLGFEEFFFFGSLIMTLKIQQHIRQHGSLTALSYLKVLAFRFARLAPIYYIVFLFGWQVGPFLGSGPCWMTYEKGFANCNEYWWSVFTMTINFIPKHVIANEGCFYWGWYTTCDLQLSIVMPWVIYGILKFKSHLVRAILVIVGILIGMGIVFFVIDSNGMAASLFAPQDVLIF